MPQNRGKQRRKIITLSNREPELNQLRRTRIKTMTRVRRAQGAVSPDKVEAERENADARDARKIPGNT